MKFNPGVQKLIAIDEIGRNYWLRIHCTDGEVFEGYADCWTYTTIGDDEDVSAIRFIRRDGTGYPVAGVEIDHFEVLGPRIPKSEEAET